jgi:hypothetical protein
MENLAFSGCRRGTAVRVRQDKLKLRPRRGADPSQGGTRCGSLAEWAGCASRGSGYGPFSQLARSSRCARSAKASPPLVANDSRADRSGVRASIRRPDGAAIRPRDELRPKQGAPWHGNALTARSPHSKGLRCLGRRWAVCASAPIGERVGQDRQRARIATNPRRGVVTRVPRLVVPQILGRQARVSRWFRRWRGLRESLQPLREGFGVNAARRLTPYRRGAPGSSFKRRRHLAAAAYPSTERSRALREEVWPWLLRPGPPGAPTARANQPTEQGQQHPNPAR